jgi:hypothetical protein
MVEFIPNIKTQLNVHNEGYVMKNSIYIFLIFSSQIFSNVIYAACTSNPAAVIDKQNDGLVGCNAAIIALKADIDGEKEYKKKLNLKLAKLVAIQSKQIMQDLGSSSDFFEQNSQSLLTTSSEVKNQCKFDFVKKLEVSGCSGTNSPEEKEKIKMLANALSGYENTTSLTENLFHVYQANKYGLSSNNTNVNQCPLNGSAYPLNAQMTEESAQEIMSHIKLAGDQPSDQYSISTYYTDSPQLAMINEADKLDPKLGFKEKFEKYIKAYNPTKDSAKKYFSDFFFNKENQKIIGKGVAQRCNQFRSSVSNFICHPPKQLASLESATSKKLFENYDPQKEFQDQKASVKKNPEAYKSYAFLCQARAEHQESITNSIKVDCLQLENSVRTVDNMFHCFSEGVKPEGLTNDSINIENFCNHFACKSSDVKDTNSCKQGGPLSSSDLAALNLKDDTVSKQIAYLQNLERHRSNRTQSILGKTTTPTEGNQAEKKPLVLSAFDLNAFGADAVMKFENLPTTEVAKKLVAQEIKDQGITPSTPEEIKKIINGETSKTTQSANIATATPSDNQTYSIAPPQENRNWQPSRRDVTATPSSTATSATNDEAVKKKLDSVRQMVDDLAQVMKASPSATSEQYKATSVPTISPNYRAETAAYESWARSLRDKETTLNDREHYADVRDADSWRRNNDFDRRGRETASRYSQDAGASERKNEGQNGAAVATKQDGNKIAFLKQGNDVAAEVSASSSGLIVTPEKLDKLEKNDLKNFGVNIDEPFIISVKMNGKLIHVRVAKVTVKGKTFLAPRLNEDNREIKEAIFKSPIFKEFRYYQEKNSAA